MLISNILKVSKEIERELAIRYSEYDLSVNQAQLLIHLYHAVSNEIKASDLQTELGIDKRLLSLTLKSLEAKNYIIRNTSTDDRRQKNIVLSISAIEFCEDLVAIEEEVNAIMIERLSSEQVLAFADEVI